MSGEITSWIRSLLGFLVTGNGVGSTAKHANQLVLGTNVTGSYNESTRVLTLTTTGGGGALGITVGGTGLVDPLTGVTELVIGTGLSVSGTIDNKALLIALKCFWEGGGISGVKQPDSIVIGTGLSAEYSEPFGIKTVTISTAAAPTSFVHAPVNATLLSAPDEYGEGLSVPTAEQADGVALTSGDRCLIYRDSAGYGKEGIWRHNGSIIVRADDDASAINGHIVTCLGGKVYRRTTFCRSVATGTPYTTEPVWLPLDGVAPRYAAVRVIAPADPQDWVGLLSFRCLITTADISCLRIRVLSLNASDTTATGRRVFDVSGIYMGTGADIVPLEDPIVFADPGETDIAARVRLVKYASGVFVVQALRSAAAGNSYTYDTRVWVESSRY